MPASAAQVVGAKIFGRPTSVGPDPGAAPPSFSSRVGSHKVCPLPDPLPKTGEGEKWDPIPSPAVRRGGGLGWGQALRARARVEDRDEGEAPPALFERDYDRERCGWSGVGSSCTVRVGNANAVPALSTICMNCSSIAWRITWNSFQSVVAK